MLSGNDCAIRGAPFSSSACIMQSDSSERTAAMRSGDEAANKDRCLRWEVAKMMQMWYVFKKPCGMKGAIFFRDHIRTRTHTSVGNVRVFK